MDFWDDNFWDDRLWDENSSVYPEIRPIARVNVKPPQTGEVRSVRKPSLDDYDNCIQEGIHEDSIPYYK